MPVLAAIAVPHPPIILPQVGRGREKEIQSTIDAYRKAMAFLAACRPDAIVLLSPHTALYSDYFHLSPGAGASGDFARFGAPTLTVDATYDQDLRAAIVREADAEGIPAGTEGEGDPALDHATAIPLVFLNEVYPNYKLVRSGFSGLPPAVHYRYGQCIATAAGDKRVAIIASADLSHRLREDGPYGFVCEGPMLDKEITDALAEGAFGRLLHIDPHLADKGAECGLRSLLVMAGALDGRSVQASLLSYEGTFGVGYAVATFAPGGADVHRRFLHPAADAGEQPPHDADPYVALARASITHYLTKGKRLKPPPGLPPEMTHKKAGVFVSLHRDGQLRGCIGTILPTTGSVAEEILRNAVSAATEDPRFPPLTPPELAGLEVSVDVLGDAEPIASQDKLDPRRYGVIVSSGGRRGLLLPALDGVDTPAQQVDIARQKAGIPSGAPLRLERFEVVRHE